MKHKFRILFLIIVVISLLGFVVYRMSQVQINKGIGEGISPFPSSFTLTANIYYLNSSSKLASEKKTLVIESNQIVDAVFEALKTKPSVNYCYCLLEENTQILSYEIVDKKLYLNLSEDILYSAYWKKDYYNEIIYAIVNTMTQFESIDRVQIRVAGLDLKNYVNDNINYNNLVYNEAINQRPRIKPEAVLKQFFIYIETGDYQSAFKLTTANKIDMPDAFVEEMKEYVRSVKDLELGNMLPIDDDGFVDITVNYEVYSIEEAKYHIVKVHHWQVYENASKYYIYWR